MSKIVIFAIAYMGLMYISYGFLCVIEKIGKSIIEEDLDNE